MTNLSVGKIEFGPESDKPQQLSFSPDRDVEAAIREQFLKDCRAMCEFCKTDEPEYVEWGRGRHWIHHPRGKRNLKNPCNAHRIREAWNGR